MNSRLCLTLLTIGCLVVAGRLVAEDAKEEEKIDLSKAKCPVSGKDIDEAAAVEHHGGKVYFCCDNCSGAFTKDAKKFTTKANHQLVLTGQIKQEKCPMSGKPIADGTTVEVSGVKVDFCCNNCQKSAAGKKGDEQLELVFSEKAFAKAFKIPSEEKEE